MLQRLIWRCLIETPEAVSHKDNYRVLQRLIWRCLIETP